MSFGVKFEQDQNLESEGACIFGAKPWSVTRISVTPRSRVISHIMSARVVIDFPSLPTRQSRVRSSASFQGRHAVWGVSVRVFREKNMTPQKTLINCYNYQVFEVGWLVKPTPEATSW